MNKFNFTFVWELMKDIIKKKHIFEAKKCQFPLNPIYKYIVQPNNCASH